MTETQFEVHDKNGNQYTADEEGSQDVSQVYSLMDERTTLFLISRRAEDGSKRMLSKNKFH